MRKVYFNGVMSHLPVKNGGMTSINILPHGRHVEALQEYKINSHTRLLNNNQTFSMLSFRENKSLDNSLRSKMNTFDNLWSSSMDLNNSIDKRLEFLQINKWQCYSQNHENFYYHLSKI